MPGTSFPAFGFRWVRLRLEAGEVHPVLDVGCVCARREALEQVAFLLRHHDDAARRFRAPDFFLSDPLGLDRKKKRWLPHLSVLELHLRVHVGHVQQHWDDRRAQAVGGRLQRRNLTDGEKRVVVLVESDLLPVQLLFDECDGWDPAWGTSAR